MVMGAFIPGLRRKYSFHEYISALLLVIGLILFTLADAQTSPNFSVIGILMICGALIMDSLMGNLQEAIFTMNPDTKQVITISSITPILIWQNYAFFWYWFLLHLFLTDWGAILLNASRITLLASTNDIDRRAV